MRNLDTRVHLSYRDILLVPYDDDACSIKSRKDPDITSEICPGVSLSVPLVSAPMDSITTADMAIAMAEEGAMGIITRFINDENEIKKQVQEIKEVKKAGHVAACAMGISNNVYEHCSSLCDAGATLICLDVANGNHVLMKKAISEVQTLKNKYNIHIIAGNVATSKAAIRLADWGAEACKAGIGGGASCVTRRVIAFGVPQLTAVMDCASALKTRNVKIIADGGIRTSGDVIKALWSGADVVMAGYIFAGHKECPTFEQGKIYRGMSSRTVSHRTDVAAEGVSVRIENKGSVKELVREYANAIKAGCAMANAHNLEELRRNVRALRVSTMSNDESEPVNEIQ